ncbi:MAG: flagellar biosynthetic protein FliR [Gammaproteobacteria bacterium]
MSLHVDTAWLLTTLLLSLRVAAATMLAPVLGPAQIPASARVVFAMTLAVLLVATLPATGAVVTAFDSLAGLVGSAFAELVIGASLSFGFLAAYAATQVAGRALDIQIGFGAGSVLNPATQNLSPLLGTLFGMVAVAVFLGMDGHHVLIKALALSAQSSPPGSFAYAPDWPAFLGQSGVMFTFGLGLAAPVMLGLLLADLSLAVLARSMPQLNVFVLSFTVKVALGLTGLAASIRLADSLLAALFGTTFRFWEGVAGAR